MRTLEEQVAEIHTREDLIAFVESLRADLEAQPETWENPTLDRFLGALASWMEDMDGYYRNRGEDIPSTPSWGTLGEILAAARVYE
jgi:hypothetical protein